MSLPRDQEVPGYVLLSELSVWKWPKKQAASAAVSSNETMEIAGAGSGTTEFSHVPPAPATGAERSEEEFQKLVEASRGPTLNWENPQACSMRADFVDLMKEEQKKEASFVAAAAAAAVPGQRAAAASAVNEFVCPACNDVACAGCMVNPDAWSLAPLMHAIDDAVAVPAGGGSSDDDELAGRSRSPAAGPTHVHLLQPLQCRKSVASTPTYKFKQEDTRITEAEYK